MFGCLLKSFDFLSFPTNALFFLLLFWLQVLHREFCLFVFIFGRISDLRRKEKIQQKKIYMLQIKGIS